MCVFVHSRFVENPPIGSWETNPCFFSGVLSQVLPFYCIYLLHLVNIILGITLSLP
jgi:hypothetical protein